MRCTSALLQNQVVVEVLGRWLTEEEYTAKIDAETEYLVSFESATLERKRASGDPYRYIDCSEHGNLMRLLNDCQVHSIVHSIVHHSLVHHIVHHMVHHIVHCVVHHI